MCIDIGRGWFWLWWWPWCEWIQRKRILRYTEHYRQGLWDPQVSSRWRWPFSSHANPTLMSHICVVEFLKPTYVYISPKVGAGSQTSTPWNGGMWQQCRYMSLRWEERVLSDGQHALKYRVSTLCSSIRWENCILVDGHDIIPLPYTFENIFVRNKERTIAIFESFSLQ